MRRGSHAQGGASRGGPPKLVPSLRSRPYLLHVQPMPGAYASQPARQLFL